MRATTSAIWIGLLSVWGSVMAPEMTAASGADAQFEQLLEARDYIALESRLSAATGIPDEDKRFYSGVLAERRNSLDAALNLLKPVLADPRAKLTGTETRIGLTALADCYVKQFRYRDAEETFDRILRLNGLSASQTKDVLESRQLMVLLHDAPAQTVSPGGAFEIPVVRNKIGLMEVPVTVAGQNRSWIFDTGANFSLVTRSVAEKLQLKLSAERAFVTRTGGVTVSTQTAIIPDLRVGRAEFHNVVVLVVDDSDFYIPQLGFQLQEFLGYPVISALQRLSFAPGRLRVLPEATEQAGITTLWLEGLTPLIALKVDDREELFVLDLGARHSYLSRHYFDRHPDYFAGKTAGSMMFGGAGPAQAVSAYSMAAVTFQLGAAQTVMKNVPVAAADTGTVADSAYGILGQDFLSRFQSFTLDFGAMTMSVGPATPQPNN
jgi:predicted aspartyl protease